MSAYPVLYEADYIEQRNRLTVFFRAFLVIPHAIVACFVGIAVFFTVVAAWFALVLTGRYPAGLYAFNSGALRWLARLSAYGYLEVDAFPPFGFADDAAYPVRVQFADPAPKYSRGKALLRILLVIPVMLIAYAMSLVLGVVVIAAWLIAVITGSMPKPLHDVLDLCLAYTMKAYGYIFLLTETYPPLSNADPTLATQGGQDTLTAAPGGSAPPASVTPAQHPGGLEG